MAKIVLKEQDEYGQNSTEGGRSERAMARIVLKEMQEYDKNSDKGA